MAVFMASACPAEAPTCSTSTQADKGSPQQGALRGGGCGQQDPELGNGWLDGVRQPGPELHTAGGWVWQPTVLPLHHWGGGQHAAPGQQVAVLAAPESSGGAATERRELPSPTAGSGTEAALLGRRLRTADACSSRACRRHHDQRAGMQPIATSAQGCMWPYMRSRCDSRQHGTCMRAAPGGGHSSGSTSPSKLTTGSSSAGSCTLAAFKTSLTLSYRQGTA